MLRVNARGIFLLMKYQIPAMSAAGGGAIVNMSSTAGLSGAPGMAAYAAAWLCSDQASFITGVTIPIDGGKLAGSATL